MVSEEFSHFFYYESNNNNNMGENDTGGIAGPRGMVGRILVGDH